MTAKPVEAVPPLTLADIEAAAKTIAGAVTRTPATHSRTLSAITGAEVVVKFENLQFTASFKERGALNRLTALTAEERRRGVIAVSAGNHAQGVAYHAGRLGIPATIVMPAFTPFVKVRQTEAFKARVVVKGDSLAEAAALAHEMQQAEGLTFIHPYDDPLVAAGQGTVALELLADFPDLEVLVVPVGGGGLIAGCATAAKALRPGIELVGVQSALYPGLHHALHGMPPAGAGTTLAEGIAVRDVGALAVAVARRLVDEVLLVDEAALERAVAMLLEVEKTVAEGAGAAPLAALLTMPERFKGRRTGLILSGGNIDSRLLAQVLMRGLVRDGRVCRFRMEIPDRPGSLAALAATVGEAGGNIIEVGHQRLFGSVGAKAAEVQMVVETRDRPHGEAILAALAAQGYPARLLGPDA